MSFFLSKLYPYKTTFPYATSYHSLANMAVHQQQAAGDNKILTEWELELGEPALDIQQSGSFIVVLGERHIFCLNDSGLIHWVKRLDYHPMCCTLQIPREL